MASSRLDNASKRRLLDRLNSDDERVWVASASSQRDPADSTNPSDKHEEEPISTCTTDNDNNEDENEDENEDDYKDDNEDDNEEENEDDNYDDQYDEEDEFPEEESEEEEEEEEEEEVEDGPDLNFHGRGEIARLRSIPFEQRVLSACQYATTHDRIPTNDIITLDVWSRLRVPPEIITRIAEYVFPGFDKRVIRCIFDIGSESFSYIANDIPLSPLSRNYAQRHIFASFKDAPMIGREIYPYFNPTTDVLSIEIDICGGEGSDNRAIHDDKFSAVLEALKNDRRAAASLRFLRLDFCWRYELPSDIVANHLTQKYRDADNIEKLYFPALQDVEFVIHSHGYGVDEMDYNNENNLAGPANDNRHFATSLIQ